MIPVFKNVGESSTPKNYRPVSILSVNNRIVDLLENCGLFSDFQYGFRSFQSTADLRTAVSDRITRAFNRSGATRAVALDISKAFDRVWHAGLLHKLKSYGISGQIFNLISSFLSNRWLIEKIYLFFQLFNQQSNALNSVTLNAFANFKAFSFIMILSIDNFWPFFPTNQLYIVLSTFS